jgi:hypothetical protein
MASERKWVGLFSDHQVNSVASFRLFHTFQKLLFINLQPQTQKYILFSTTLKKNENVIILLFIVGQDLKQTISLFHYGFLISVFSDWLFLFFMKCMSGKLMCFDFDLEF